MINELPDPVLMQIYRLKAVMGPAQEFGDTPASRRRVVPLAAGTFTGPELNGNLLPGGSACWQLVSSNGLALVEVRYTLETDEGALLYVQSSGYGQGAVSRERLIHSTTRIETAGPSFDWLNRGVFVTVAGATPVHMLHETYLVG